jgi:hypothetical protein
VSWLVSNPAEIPVYAAMLQLAILVALSVWVVRRG